MQEITKPSKAPRRSATLPDDLIFEILCRLPAKTVGRFRTVCKRWLSLTNNPRFINAHASLAPITGFFLQHFDPGPKHFPICSGESSCLSALSDPSLSFLNYRGLEATFHCSCNGLILCSYRPKHRLLCACNPITKQRHIISPPQGDASKEDKHRPRLGLFFTLAFDPSRSQRHFKVYGLEDAGETPKIYVYSSATQSWKPLNDVCCDGIIETMAVYWNGSLVWLCSDDMLLVPWEADEGGGPVRRLPRPPNQNCMYIGESRGCLHFIGRSDSHPCLMVDVMEMESESAGWSRLHRVDLKIMYRALGKNAYGLSVHKLSTVYIRPCVCFLRGEGKEGDQILLSALWKIVSYNFQKRTLRRVCRYDLRNIVLPIWCEANPHAHTLFPIYQKEAA